MDKVSKIGIGICVALLVVWFIHTNKQDKKNEQSETIGKQVSEEAAPSPAIKMPVAVSSTPIPIVEPVVQEKSKEGLSGEDIISFEKDNIRLETPLLTAELSPWGGVIKEVVLKENPETGIRGLPQDETGDVVLMDTSSPMKSLGWLSNVTCKDMEVTREGLKTIFSGQDSAGSFLVNKIYSFDPDTYLVDLEVTIQNVTSQALSLQGGPHLVCGSMGPIDPKDSLGVDIMTPTEVQRKTQIEELTAARVEWLGLKTKYFTAITKPVTEPGTAYQITGKMRGADKERAILGCSRGAAASPYEYLRATMEFEDIVMAPGESRSYEFIIFLGPANYDLLKAEGYGFEDIIDLGFLAPICKVIIWLLNRIYGILGSYGWAIIILTLLVKLILWPLTHKSYKSMKQMQLLKPQIDALKEKCKGDSKKLQAETMKLYKEHGANPMSGCLPMILQMPILFALFTSLRNTILLRNAPFWIIPGKWIQNLSGPDHLATLPSSLPIIGNQLNILPLLMGLTFFLQQKITPQAPAASDQAAQQQKMMATLMPAIFTLMFYTLPSGLNLYFTLSTLITILQQGALRKKSA